LIVQKIVKVVASRCVSCAKYAKNAFAAGAPPLTCWGSLAGFKRAYTFKGSGQHWRRVEGKERGGRYKGRGNGKGKVKEHTSTSFVPLRALTVIGLLTWQSSISVSLPCLCGVLSTSE